MSDQPEISFPLDWEFRIVTLTPQTGQAEAACLGILHRVDPKAAISRGL